MNTHEDYMNRCLELAKLGFGKADPNPMVGCVIVYEGKVIAEGYHQQYGGPHAEVNAINNVSDKSILKDCTLYVNLEPCAHFGKTPPCADLITKHQVKEVFIGCVDSFSEVSGKGIEKMESAGIDVKVGILEKESLELNKRFFTFHNQKRPYIILKWAQTKDGFIDINRNVNTTSDNWITSPLSKKLVHQWRTQESAIMIGTNTALNDNPQLTSREWQGKNPTRIVLDMNNRLSDNLNVFDGSVPTYVICKSSKEAKKNLEYIPIKGDNLIEEILTALHQLNIQSVIIEGGAKLLTEFIGQNYWDEARVFTGNKYFKEGLPAPELEKEPTYQESISTDELSIYYND